MTLFLVKRFFTILSCLVLFTGCVKGVDYSLKATTFDQFQHLRAGLRNDSLIVAIPIVISPRKTGGIRSIVDFRAQFDVTNIISKKEVILPNGVIFMNRIRW